MNIHICCIIGIVLFLLLIFYPKTEKYKYKSMRDLDNRYIYTGFLPDMGYNSTPYETEELPSKYSGARYIKNKRTTRFNR